MDVAASSITLIEIWKGVSNGALNFSFESDGKIAFDAPQGFRPRVDIIDLTAGGCIERIHVRESYLGGSLASKSDLLLLRAVTVVDRGCEGVFWTSYGCWKRWRGWTDSLTLMQKS